MVKGAKKKKNRKLRRQVRKTIGALLMASAIVVAAIPVQDVSANLTTAEKIKVAVTSKNGEIKSADKGYPSVVPYVIDEKGDPNNQVIYTSGDGLFKFAYIRGVGAVILEYKDSMNSDSVVIPDRLKAYRNYSPNNQGPEYYCLVSANDELMGYMLNDQPLIEEGTNKYYYQTIGHKPDGVNVEELQKITNVERNPDGTYYYSYLQTKRDESGQIVYDDDGNEVKEPATCEAVQMYGPRWYPCYYSQEEVWSKIPEEDLYYRPKIEGTNQDDYSQWKGVSDDPSNINKHKSINAIVKYIGAEKIKTNGAGWALDGFRSTCDEGVFANNIDIINLKIEADRKSVV